MSVNVTLLFVPGWTLCTGSPHLALPLLRAVLERHGIEVTTRDLNFEFAGTLGGHIDESAASNACLSQSLEDMNAPYFKAEDELMKIASTYGGHWNAQLGFWYEGHPHRSSRQALSALRRPSPFSNFFEGQVVPELLRQKPNIIALGLASEYQILPALQLSLMLRDAGYKGFIVFGGNTVSRLINEMAVPRLFDLVDGLIEFQGEIPLLRLCQALDTGQSLQSVPQLVWRDENAAIRKNHRLALLEPESMPTADFTGLPVGQYWGNNYLTIVAARGCYYGRCNFCAIPYGWGSDGFAGARSPGRTYEDMLTLRSRYGINRFKFVDEALSPNFMRVLAEMILSDGIELEWEAYVRFESVWYDQSFVDLVGRAGFRKGYFGLEVLPSTSRSVLNKKDHPVPDVLLKTCASAGVKVHFFCMFGYPGTGTDDAARTVEFLLKNQQYIDTADIFPWGLAKHTAVDGIQPVLNGDDDWALEFTYQTNRHDALAPLDVQQLVSYYEELVWSEVPRFLHPTYRLLSPWQSKEINILALESNRSPMHT